HRRPQLVRRRVALSRSGALRGVEEEGPDRALQAVPDPEEAALRQGRRGGEQELRGRAAGRDRRRRGEWPACGPPPVRRRLREADGAARGPVRGAEGCAAARRREQGPPRRIPALAGRPRAPARGGEDGSETMAVMTLWEAVNDALKTEMRRDPRVVV